MRRRPKQRVERLAVEELHDEVGGVALGADVEHGDHVGVVDARCCFRLAQEPGARVSLRGHRGQQRFDGEALLENGVDRLVDGPHAAFTQQPDDAVLPEQLVFR